MNDKLRAAIIAAITSLVDVLALVGVIHLTTEQIAGLDLAIGNAVVLFFLLFKTGQEPDPAA